DAFFGASIHALGTLGESAGAKPPPGANWRLLAARLRAYTGRMSDLNYAASGVDYDLLDLFKRECQQAAATTGGALARHGLAEPPAVRGESAYLIETPDAFFAHVEEGLGTKVLVADA